MRLPEREKIPYGGGEMNIPDINYFVAIPIVGLICLVLLVCFGNYHD